MKKTSLLIASLALIGAGCQQPVPTPNPNATDAYQYDPNAAKLTVPTSPEPQPTPPPSEIPPPGQEISPSMNDKTWAFPGILPAAKIQGKQVRMETSKGTIVFELFGEDAPKAVSNFVYLTEGGYYDGLTFHRVESWVVQGGDPTGTGRGGPGYKFEDETVTKQYVRGVVAMANAGPNTNGSQFFFLTQDTPLPPAYTIFGTITEGLSVIDKLAIGDKMTKVTVENK